MNLLGLLDSTERLVTLVKGDASVDISCLAIDSRKVGQGSLFIALPGSRVNGIDYVEAALKRGARAVLVPEDAVKKAKEFLPAGTVLLSSHDIRYAAGYIAHAFFGKPSERLKVIGITGTNGKTTCSYIIEAILKAWGQKTAVSGTICQRIGDKEVPSSLTTPDCISFHRFLKEALDQGVQYVITEVSSHALDQGRVAGCRFEASLFTNLTRDHLDYHGSLEEYFRAKERLFVGEYTKKCIINIDDPFGQRLWRAAKDRGLSYSLSMKKADVYASGFELDSKGIKARLRLGNKELEITSGLLGKHNLSNILGASAVALALDVPLEVLGKGIASANVVPGRLEPVSENGITGLVDYAHTPDALKNVLLSLRDMKGHGDIITVCGCGGDRDKGKRPEMAAIAAALSDLAVFTSDNPRTEDPSAILRDMLEGVRADLLPRVRVIEDRKEAIYWACSQAHSGDIILVAGKGHENYQIIGDKKRPFNDKKVLTRGLGLRSKQRMSRENRALKAGCTPVLENVRKATGGRVDDKFRFLSFDSVCTDSRKVSDGCLFWALKGERFDGNLFAASALRRGAAAAVCERVPEGFEGKPVVEVSDGLWALGDFARWYKTFLGFKAIAITGSCGKTTTKDLVYSVVSTAFSAGATRGNFNNLVGLPLTIFSMKPGTQWAVLEMGTNVPGEIKRLCQIARPEIGLVTCVRPVHLQGLGSLENIALEKGFLFESLPPEGTAIVNLDDELVVRQAKRTAAKKVLGFGTKERAFSGLKVDHPVLVSSWRAASCGLAVKLLVDGKEVEARSRLAGYVNVSNIAAAFCVGVALDIPTDLILQGLEGCAPPKGRMNMEEFKGWIIIDDSYNANPSSMDAALGFLDELPRDYGRNLVLGDMLELGQESRLFHEELGRKAAKVKPSVLLAVGEMAEHLAQGAESAGLSGDRIAVFKTSAQAARFLKKEEGLFFNGTKRIVLIKGSRGVKLEEVASVIKERLMGEGS